MSSCFSPEAVQSLCGLVNTAGDKHNDTQMIDQWFISHPIVLRSVSTFLESWLFDRLSGILSKPGLPSPLPVFIRLSHMVQNWLLTEGGGGGTILAAHQTTRHSGTMESGQIKNNQIKLWLAD